MIAPSDLIPIIPRLTRRCISWVQPRKGLAVGIVFVIVAIVALCAVQSRSTMSVPLFTAALHPSQVMEIERALTLWNEPYLQSGSSNEILVPAGMRRQLLLRLTIAGLPHGYVPTTADVLSDASGPFVPQTALDDRRRAGIEGDLVASLRGMHGIADASVVIAPAAATVNLFDDKDNPKASASVALVLQSGAQLTAAEISGITRLVAASYPGLVPERVAVVDSFGNLQAPLSEQERISGRELRLQTSIQSALDAVFGVGSSVVRVTFSPAASEVSIDSTRVVPHGVLESESGNERGREKERSYSRVRDTRRYAYDTIVERHMPSGEAPGHLAIAVFLDATKVSGALAASITDLVRAAAAADIHAGDEVIVKSVPFSSVAQTPAVLRSGMRPFLSAASMILAALGVIGLACGAWLHMREAPTPMQRAGRSLHATLEYELPQTAAYVLRSMPANLREHVLSFYQPEQRRHIEWHLNGSARG